MVLLSSKDDMSEKLSNPVAKLAKSSLTLVCEIAGNIFMKGLFTPLATSLSLCGTFLFPSL